MLRISSLILICCTLRLGVCPVQAQQPEFGIGGWIHDPVSIVSQTWPPICYYTSTPLSTRLQNVNSCTQDMLGWLDEMNYQTLCVVFSDPTLYERMSGHRVKCANVTGPTITMETIS